MVRKTRKTRVASSSKKNRTSGSRRNSKSTLNIEVTEFSKIAEELYKYKQMVDLASHGCVIVDVKGDVLYVNDCFARIHGYNARWLLGRNLKIFHNAEQLKHVRFVNNRLIKKGKGLNNEEIWDKHRDGTVFPMLMSTWLMKDKSGRPVIECATAVDISELRKREAELEAGKKTQEAMLNATSDLVALLDKDFKYVDMNENMAKSLKLPREQLIGKDSLAHTEPEVAAIRRANLKKVLATGKPVVFDHISHGRIFRASLYPVNSSEGKITGIVIFAKDVTQQKKAEAEIEAGKKTLETMLNATNDLVAMIDRQCNIVEVNKKMADAFEKPREQLIGRCAWDFHTPEIAAQRRAKVEHVMAMGEAMTFVDSVEDGKTYRNSCYPLKGPDGKVTGMVVFSKDVTQEKKAEAELSHYREELIKLRRSAYLDLFGAVIGHQLSQPLTVINVLMEEIVCDLEIGSFEKGKILESLKTCLREANTAAETIHKMRKLTKQWVEGRAEHFSPLDVIMEVVSSLELKAKQAKMRIEVKEPKFLPTTAGYRSAFEQIVLNITENAIEAADQKKWHRLVISAEKTDSHIELKFSDDCCGIAKENLGKIFEPFYSTKTNRVGKSMGLGLPIIYRILTAIGGEIRVKSTVGKGTTFYVNLPLSKYIKGT